ncbi:MAG TPA: nicotinamide riboside transporter PnuC [Gemmatimonadaceae bacterium]|jgi:nicotinamide mononucleotide transporter|nr:nicotinamide riboside transporter PnuC [Gemmatimonadaceae bacterium]
MSDVFTLWSGALAWLTHPVFVVAGMPMSWGDLSGFATGIICVWLAARANIWNFHFGILNSAILGLVFVQQRLFADASLQVVFIVLNARGLQAWRAGQQVSASAPVFRGTRREQALMLLSIVGMAPVLWYVLGLMKGSAPLIDALVTSLSIVAQWLLNRRVLENWIWWIVVDLISIPLYVSRGLPLIAALYVVFLLLCCQGYVRWRALVVPEPAEVAA